MENNTLTRVREILEPLLRARGLCLYDLQFRKEGKNYNLHVILDRADSNPVSIEDCEAISRNLGDELDRIDIINEQYILQVESPGLDRELLKDSDFERFSGYIVDVHLFAPIDGSKLYVGKLLSKTTDSISILLDNACNYEIPVKSISKVNLHIDF